MPEPISVFTLDAEGVDPALVPQKTLASGAAMPAVGLGTFGSDRYSPQEIAQAVIGAAQIGYRHFDCASVYGNEKEVGGALKAVLGGVPREELWITSKVWNDKHELGQVIASCRQSLADLGLDYLDLYLVHWPFPNSHGKGVDVHSRDPPRKALCPGRLHADLAADGAACRNGPGAACRHVQHDHSKIGDGPA